LGGAREGDHGTTVPFGWYVSGIAPTNFAPVQKKKECGSVCEKAAGIIV
jgi:hypothetical protein